MTRWWTSDQHFGHENIIRYCGRPFSDATEMGNTMVDHWNDVVADSDEVWILGDLVLGDLIYNLQEYVSRLKGRKILVPGNHDVCWQGKKKGGRQHHQYHDLGGIARIVDNPKPIRFGKATVNINHFPHRLHLQYDQKMRQWRLNDDGNWLLHGHIHQHWQQYSKQINVGVDVWEFTPINDDVIQSIIAAGSTVKIGEDHIPGEWGDDRRGICGP